MFPGGSSLRAWPAHARCRNNRHLEKSRGEPWASRLRLQYRTPNLRAKRLQSPYRDTAPRRYQRSSAGRRTEDVADDGREYLVSALFPSLPVLFFELSRKTTTVPKSFSWRRTEVEV